MTSLSTLLEQSKRLQSSLSTTTNPSSSQQQHNTIDPLPSLHLGFEQIEQQSRRVASRSLKENGAVGGGNAAYLLASGGVNADLLSSNINNVGNLAATFEPLVPLSDTDVEGYLRHTHEQAIISAIEENRRQTTQDFYRSLDNRMRRDWERQKERLFEELGRHQPISSVVGGAGGVGGGKETPRKGRGGFESGSPSAPLSSIPASSSSNGGAGGSLQMHAKMMRYDRVIRRLNEFRKEGFAFGVVNALGEAVASGGGAGQGGDARSTQLLDTYSLLSRLVNEHDVLHGEFQRTALQERQYAGGYLDRDQEAEGAREVRRMVAEGARGWLEEQFLSYVDKTIASRPAEANLGGVPSVQNKIRAFLNVRYGDGKGGWKGPALEIANGTPLWARIYYLLRSGHPHEALKFAEENSSSLATLEKSFLAYFKAYLDSPQRRLPKLLRDRFLAEYNQRIRYLTDTSDPYKHALYKLIGRVEIQRRNVPGVTQTTEDWLWFQLSLVRESGGGDGEVEAPHEKYGLRDLAAVLRKFGEQHFDPKGTRPLLYFQVLLLSGQFERAIALLAPHPAYHADAVHFAIALAYYGLLRVPADGQAKNGDGELLVDPSSPTPSLSFSRLLHRYTRLFARTDATEALQYLYLICLSADTNPGEVKVAQGLVRELVMETRQYGALLGDVRGDGTKVPGQIERDLKLLHLPDSRAYLLDIVKAAASRADLEQRFSEAILLYNLAEEYDAVISVLNVELGNSLSRPSATTSLAGPTSVANANKVGLAAAAAQEDVVAVAKSILEHYDRSAGMGGKVSRKRRETCECLMRLKEGLGLFERGELEAALATIESTSLLPLSPNSSTDLVSLIRQAESLPSLDDALVRNLDVVLVATMTILYRLHQQLRESPYGADGSRVQKMEELRARARGVMMFAGMLRYRLTNDTYSTLTKLDVYLN